MSGFGRSDEFLKQYVVDAPVSRRSFLAASGLALASLGFAPAAYANQKLETETLISVASPPLWGMAMAYGEGRLDVIDLDGSQILHSFEGFRATHAITPIEHLNRFVIHGARIERTELVRRAVGALMVVEVDPVAKSWEILLYKDIEGGIPLHWQPNPEHTEIVFNTTGDGSLHVLDTRTLEITRYVGGGEHSNMAMFDDLLIATDALEGPTNVLVTDRKTNTVLSTTPIGTWGHGITVNTERGEAFVWSKEGGHRISLASASMGQHLGMMEPFRARQRSWFCWTPQGGRFTHGAAWNKGDVYDPYLLAVDMKAHKFEQIPTGDTELMPSFLQVSPDGKWGLASMQGFEEVGVFDLTKNEFLGTVDAGPANLSFFERDMAFCRNRDYALVTNSAEKSLSLLDLAEQEELRRIYLPRRPDWIKVLSPA